MNILITGASGVVGRAVTQVLEAQGHKVTPLARTKRDGVAWWDIDAGQVELGPCPSPDVVIHLAGENIASGRWTPAIKGRIRDSRVNGTRLLANHLAAMPQKPRAFICASAIGYYGSRGDDPLEETAPPGSGFLADVCRGWEAAADPAREAGIRTVHARLGIVLSRTGGALARMLTPFRLGIGGCIGNGRQYMSWVHIDDVANALADLAAHDNLAGPVNLVAPHPVTNHQFTKTLGHALHRPTVLPMPTFAVRLLLGEMGDALLLSSIRVKPAVLSNAGFAFRFPSLHDALNDLLQENGPQP